MDRRLATPRDVADFLAEFQATMDFGRRSMRARRKNTQGLIDLGITERMAWEELKELGPENYVAGPMPDDTDDSKEVWVFGTVINGTEAYIKLRLAPVPGKQHVHHATIWSFHPAEHALSYPLRKENRERTRKDNLLPRV